MDDCCSDKEAVVRALRERQARVLYVVLALNAILFVVEFVAGWLSRSVSLLGDSLDMFGDAAVYAVTLYVLHRSATARAQAALFKGAVMFLLGAGVLVEVGFKLVHRTCPTRGRWGSLERSLSPATSCAWCCCSVIARTT